MPHSILCITDQVEGADHSSIEGIFNGYLRSLANVTVTFFSLTRHHPAVQGHHVFLPYRTKRRNIVNALGKVVNVDRFDVVIVRNYFPTLKQLLDARSRFGFELGFWHSFPHAFRRIHEARLSGKAILRKRVEYALARLTQNRLVRQCDFLITMSDTFLHEYYPDLPIPAFALPMGIDAARLPLPVTPDGPIKRFIYTGTIDGLRGIDTIVTGFTNVASHFELDIYTQSDNATTRRLAGLDEPRIRLHRAIPRNELLTRIATYDVGVGLIPNNRLYRVSSPTKTIEYCAMGVPAMINSLPEYDALFDNTSAFFCPFTSDGIHRAVDSILAMSHAEIRNVGVHARDIVLAQRNYEQLSIGLLAFLNRVTQAL